MYIGSNSRISEAIRYIEQLDWWLVPVRGHGSHPKAPLFTGWTDYRPDTNSIQAILSFHGDAGVGINLGGSGLVDLEADSAQGEAALDELCHGFDFPCYSSKRSKHRLFQVPEGLEYLKDSASNIEFRTGRHQSVLPPSIFAEQGTEYRWLVPPWNCPPPPLPQHIQGFYSELKAKPSARVTPTSKTKKQQFRYRDDLDYVLRNYDLLYEVLNAGLQLYIESPDRNGNVPCYVPAALRDGQDDDSPSGVFNVYNGVLRDFATGKNHRFFRVMSALTGSSWQELLGRYESNAASLEGRPHSRRVGFPGDAISEEDRVPLETARAELLAYYDKQLSRPAMPGTLHVILGPPGVGKTYGLCQKVVEQNRNAIILTLENKLAGTHDQMLKKFGGKARRMPVLRETTCPHPDEYEAMARRGFQASKSYPCKGCPIGTANCPYLLGFSDLEIAAQLCCAAVYHTHDDFYKSHGNENRDILIFDENCIDLLLEPIQYSISQWRAWLGLAKSYSKFDIAPFQALVVWLTEAEKTFLALPEIDGKKPKYQVYGVPANLHNPEITKLEKLNTWLSRQAHKSEHRQVQNLYSAARYLLNQLNCGFILERFNPPDKEEFAVVRFRKKNPLPKDKEVFVLDATASESLLRAVAPDWDIRVWACPSIEQAGTIIQIMDYDTSRNHIRKAVARHDSTNPAWLVQVIDAILEKYGPCPIITFKDVIEGKTEFDLLSKLKHFDKISEKYNFPCRSHTFDDKALLVVGTPYKDEAAVWELALAIWGREGLPTSEYRHRQHEDGDFVAKSMGYDEDRLKPLEEFVISADLVQAIGRVRPLQNMATVFVVSNAQLSGWQVQQYMASELFDLRKVLRKDSADSYAKYARAAFHLLDQEGSASNKRISEAIEMSPRTGSTYWKLFMADNKGSFDDHKGTIWRVGSPSPV